MFENIPNWVYSKEVGMKIEFYQGSNNRSPVLDFIKKQIVQDRARILAILQDVEECGYDAPRVKLRQIRGKLWEVKIKGKDSEYRIFYITITNEKMVLLHAYKKKTQKAPTNEINIAEKRMKEVIDEKDNA